MPSPIRPGIFVNFGNPNTQVMKSILCSALLLLSITATAQRWNRDWSLGYTFANPVGKMKTHINSGHGVVIDYNFLSPDNRFAVGLDLNYSIYGYDNSNQMYEFPDGTQAEMEVNVSNSFLNMMAAGRYYLTTGKALSPYVGLKAGYALYNTTLNIYDRDDFDNCAPVETEILSKDGTFVFSLGGGVQYDLGRVFKKLQNNMLLLHLSAYYTQGGMVNYMSVDAPDHQHTITTSNRDNVEATFINTQTQITHKHHVGYLYNSYARMMDFRLAFSFRMNN